MPAGERVWLVRLRDGSLEWALIKPFADGSAILRTSTDFKTCAPPNGPREALSLVDAEGYLVVEQARKRGLVGGDDEPPSW